MSGTIVHCQALPDIDWLSREIKLVEMKSILVDNERMGVEDIFH